ncbi:hypothetical protein OMCYN_01021 [cyanobiont of Ornithocercus magnificus]|nr:hypothetical protein OMCYN_01021 [cyanobiont of Ornithocercus magnificus]
MKSRLRLGVATLGVSGLLSLAVLATSNFEAWSSQNRAIARLCLAGFNAAMNHAGKDPPAGMADYTCQCFMKQVNAELTIVSAQATCSERAAARFQL